MALRTRNTVMLVKIESSEGVEETPSASTDAVACENLSWRPAGNLINTNEYTGSLDGLGSIVGGQRIDLSVDVYMKGSGTAATAPEFNDLLKICGLTEVVTSTAVPSSPEACGAGGSTTTAQLGSSAGTTAQQYRGMPVNFASEVTGSSFISDYTTGKVATLTDTFAAIDADTTYQIPVNVLYKPNSGTIPSATLNLFRDGVKYIFAGARGNVSYSIDTGGVGKFTFNINAMFGGTVAADVSVPSATLQSTRPPVFKGGRFKIARSSAAIQNFSMNFGNSLVNPDNPAASEGFDPAVITARRITGSFNPAATLVATRDNIADFRAGTQKLLSLSYGSATGNRIGIVIPTALYTGLDPADRSGIAAENIAFEAVGQDAGAFLCFY